VLTLTAKPRFPPSKYFLGIAPLGNVVFSLGTIILFVVPLEGTNVLDTRRSLLLFKSILLLSVVFLVFESVTEL
jgi:hypothetical protein